MEGSSCWGPWQNQPDVDGIFGPRSAVCRHKRQAATRPATILSDGLAPAPREDHCGENGIGGVGTRLPCLLTFFIKKKEIRKKILDAKGFCSVFFQ